LPFGIATVAIINKINIPNKIKNVGNKIKVFNFVRKFIGAILVFYNLE
jgi:hypothetical protein